MNARPIDVQSVYVMAADETGPCKIGRALNPEKRLREIQTGHAHPLTLYYVSPCLNPTDLEYQMHQLFSSRRLSGEWFDITVAEAVTGFSELYLWGKEAYSSMAYNPPTKFEALLRAIRDALKRDGKDTDEDVIYSVLSQAALMRFSKEAWLTMWDDWMNRGAPDLDTGVPQLKELDGSEIPPIEKLP